MDEPSIAPAAYPPSYTYTPPTWPPPSGGAPFPGNELGPVANPNYAGANQSPTIPISPPLAPGYPPPFGNQKGTTYPMYMGAARNGQNQGPGFGLPPTTKPWEVGPIKAPPTISAGNPPYIMGPGPQGTQPYEVGPIAGTPPPGTTFPAGSFLDGFSSTPL